MSKSILIFMSRILRVDVSGEVYHVINRANGRMCIFPTDADYQHFENLLKEAQKKFDIQILAYTIMPNHWHLVLSTKKDGDLSKCMHWLTLTHTQQYRVKKQTVGEGHLYQGRYRSFLVSQDQYLVQLIRYVEQNPLRARLVKNSADWKWGSLPIRMGLRTNINNFIGELPTNLPYDYVRWVNELDDKGKLEEIRASVDKGKPLGKQEWVEKMTDKFKLHSLFRPKGRPKKAL